MSLFNGHEGPTRKWAKLDWVLVNVPFINLFQSMRLEYLARETSDHKLMMLHLSNHSKRYGLSLFRFQNMWNSHENFLSFMRQVWMEQVHGLGLSKHASKLNRSKTAPKRWNKEDFGRVDLTIKELENQLTDLEE